MSEQQGDNQKNREMYCPKCHSYSFSDKTEARCYNCGSILITVVRNSISGQRITGEMKK